MFDVKRLITVGLSVFAVVAIGAYVFFTQTSKRINTEDVSQGFIEAQNLYKTNPSMAQVQFENVLKNVVSGSQAEGRTKLSLGSILLRTDQGLGAEMLKGVSVNNSYLPETRSRAVNSLIFFYGAVSDISLVTKELFSGEKWRDFLASNSNYSSSTAVFLAKRSAMLWSYEMSNNFPAAYYVAYSRARGISTASTKTAKDRLYAKAIEMMANGDRQIALKQQNKTYIESYLGPYITSLLYKASALGYLCSYSCKPSFLDDASRVYEEALSLANSYKNLYSAINLRPKIEISYAEFLLRQIKPIPTVKIHSLLDDAIKTHTQYTDNGLSSLVKSSDGASSMMRKTTTVKLAASYKPYKDFLLSIGWKESDFK